MGDFNNIGDGGSSYLINAFRNIFFHEFQHILRKVRNRNIRYQCKKKNNGWKNGKGKVKSHGTGSLPDMIFLHLSHKDLYNSVKRNLVSCYIGSLETLM